MINLNSKMLSRSIIAVASLMLVVPSITFAKGHHHGRHSGHHGHSGKSGKHGNSGCRGNSGKSGKHGHHGGSGGSGSGGSGNCGDPIVSTGYVCGVVFHDTNNNGRQDNGEEGTRNIVVSVLDSNGDMKTTKTRITGSYCVEDVAVGDAKVTIEESTLPLTAKLTVGDNPSDIFVEADTRNDAGKDGYIFPEDSIDETGEVCGVVFLDTNANNGFDSDDTLLDNVTVNIKNDNGNNIASETTDSRGKYCIADIPTGKVIVDIDEDTLPENSGQVVGENPSSIIVEADETNWAGIDGYGKPDVQTGKVCGMVFLDTNKNHSYDNDDQPIEDVTIYLNDDNDNTFATQQTDSEGNYCLSNVPVGSVTVGIARDTLPKNLVQVVGENQDTITVEADKENWAGIDGFASSCDCSSCQ